MATTIGSYKGSGANRKQWNGKRWVSKPVAVAQTAKPSTRSGQGGRGGNTTRRGSTTTTSTGRNWSNGYGAKSSKPSSGNTTGRNWSNAHGQVSDKPSEGDRSTWSNKPTTSGSSSSSRSSSTSGSSGVARPSRTPQSSDMDANYAAFAKAHPKLAAKVKPGQAGYESIQKALGKGGSSSSTSSSRTGTKGTGPLADGAAYASDVEGSRRRGTSGVGPIKDGQSYADDVTGSRRPANRSADWLRDNFRPDGTDARSGVRRGIRAAGAADKSNQASQASKHYQSGNTFGAYDGMNGGNVGHGSTKDFAPKKKSLKDALKEITSKFKRGRANPYN